MKIILLGVASIITALGGLACSIQSNETVEAANLQETVAVSLQPAPGYPPAPVVEQQNNIPEAILLWEGPALFAEDQTECHRLLVTKENQALIGQCDSRQTEVELITNGKGGLADMITRFAPFQAGTPQGRITFNGQGEIAGPAWERAITTWAQFTYAELATGHIGAANRTVLAWKVGEQEGQCQMLVVLSHGYATAARTPCEGGQMEVIASDWVDTAEWEQFDAWLYNRAPLYQDNSYLDGHGTTEMSRTEAAALAEWAKAVYAKLTQTGSIPANPALFLITDDNGKYGFVDPTGQFIIEPQFAFAENFANGVAPVELPGQYGLINKQGKFIYGPLKWPL
jgi:hypothetical protein